MIIEKNITIEDTSEVAKIAMSFYNWYIHGEKPKNWRPDASMNEDSTVSFHNSETYLGLLKELGTLSERFIEREKERMDECGQYLTDTDWSEADHGSTYAYAEGPCEWLAYDYWFRSQEKPNKTELTKLDIQEKTAIAEIDFYFQGSDGRKYKENYSVKEFLILTVNNGWRIDSISHSYLW